MAYSNILVQKAQQFRIDINEPSGLGELLVCKRMLVGLSDLLRTDLRKAVKKINMLESELREVKNVLSDMSYSPKVVALIGAGYITSIERILISVNEAYGHVYAAWMVREEGGNKAEVHFAVSQCLISCQVALLRVLPEFLI